ncbi:MAG: hypothetical protein KatS3mg108_2569 [Isosphaeraceae bacterium]|jgi:hypothetical protein|nr:MAG: hypothetical protein KatS3mg108_2569 [Isosphaeraceae bacterium]
MPNPPTTSYVPFLLFTAMSRIMMQEPGGDVDRFLKLLPTTSTLNDPPRQIVAEGYVKWEGSPGVSFRLRWRDDESAEFVLGDATDGTPVLICAERQALVYDPERGSVWHYSGVEPYFRFLLRDTLQFACGIRTPNLPEGDVPRGIVIDIRSIFASKSVAREVTKPSPTSHRMVHRTERGNTSVATIEASLQVPVFTVELVPPDEEMPEIALTYLRIDGDAEAPRLRVPTRAELAEEFDVRDGADARGRALGANAMNAILLRIAAHSPKFREKLAQFRLLNVDWEAVRRNDERLAPRMKKICQSPIIIKVETR